MQGQGVVRSDQKRENMSKGRMGDRLKKVERLKGNKRERKEKRLEETSREIENMHSLITLTNPSAPRKCN